VRRLDETKGAGERVGRFCRAQFLQGSTGQTSGLTLNRRTTEASRRRVSQSRLLAPRSAPCPAHRARRGAGLCWRLGDHGRLPRSPERLPNVVFVSRLAILRFAVRRQGQHLHALFGPTPAPRAAPRADQSHRMKHSEGASRRRVRLAVAGGGGGPASMVRHPTMRSVAPGRGPLHVAWARLRFFPPFTVRVGGTLDSCSARQQTLYCRLDRHCRLDRAPHRGFAPVSETAWRAHATPKGWHGQAPLVAPDNARLDCLLYTQCTRSVDQHTPSIVRYRVKTKHEAQSRSTSKRRSSSPNSARPSFPVPCPLSYTHPSPGPSRVP
jgi:hypothetical protein